MKNTPIFFLLTMLSLVSCNTVTQKINQEEKTTPMNTKDFTTTILVDKTPQEAFNAINNVRGWWSEEIEGSTDKLNAEFTITTKMYIAAK
jgi:predicted dithiol-disulfide oxidoreductase (DUF899 family)